MWLKLSLIYVLYLYICVVIYVPYKLKNIFQFCVRGLIHTSSVKVQNYFCAFSLTSNLFYSIRNAQRNEVSTIMWL
jgi:hypothetical protein